MKNFTFLKLLCTTIILVQLSSNLCAQYPSHNYPYLNIPNNIFHVSASGKDTCKVIINSNTSWTDSTDAEWLTLDKDSGSYDNTITVIVNEANPYDTGRTAIITVNCWFPQTVMINQASYNPVLSVPTDTIKLGDTTNLLETFQITSNTAWTVTSSATWLSVTPAGGTNNREVIIVAEMDTTLTERNAFIIITADKVDTVFIPVKQSKDGPSHVLWDNSFQVVPSPYERPLQCCARKQNSLKLICVRKSL